MPLPISPHSVSPPSHILSASSMNSLQLCNITNARSYKVCIFQMSALSSRLLTPYTEITRLRHCASHHQHLCTTAMAVHSQSANTALDFLPHLPCTHIHPVFNLPCAPGRTQAGHSRTKLCSLSPIVIWARTDYFSHLEPYFGIEKIHSIRFAHGRRQCAAPPSAQHIPPRSRYMSR